MISLKELNPHSYPTTPEIDQNLIVLLERINKVRDAWGKPMTVTSGLRSQAQQDALIAAGVSKAIKSHHLMGEAVDIYDDDGSLKEWIVNNVPLLEGVGLWMEALASTKNWVHFQIVPPASGRRFFFLK